MPLALSDYVELVKRYLNDFPDKANRVYPDAQIVAALNSAQRDFAIEIASTRDFFRQTVSMDMETGNMALPDDFLAGLSATLVTSTTNGSRIRLPIQTMGSFDDQQPYWREVAAVQWPQKLLLNVGPTGAVLYAFPQPTATITNGIFLSYVVNPTEMEDDADESEVMVMFPSLQRTLLPFGALKQLIWFEGGSADDQGQKYQALWDNEIAKAHRVLNGLYRGVLQLSPAS